MATERILIATPETGRGARIIASPFQFLVTGEDNLRVRVWNSSATAVLAITGRMRLTTGEVQVFTHTLTPPATRDGPEMLYPLGDGFVLNITVELIAGLGARGQCYVTLELVRGLSGAIATLGTIAAGYVARFVPLAWPGSAIENPLEGRGFYSVNTGVAPAAGFEVQLTVPARVRWQLHELYARLTTSGVAGVRRAILQASDAIGRQRWVSCAPYQQNAAETVDYTWTPGLAHETTILQGTSTMGVPWPHVLGPGTFLQTIVAGLKAADQWGAPIYCVEEWIDIWG